MKIVKLSLVLVAAVAAIIGLSTASYAFHSGGVAECMGCHNIHDAASTSALLIGSDISSTCLECHGETSPGSYHIASMNVGGTNNGIAPRQMTPGGDFGWVLKTFTWSPRSGTSETEVGDIHGHNIIAGDFGFNVDGTNAAAPGGDMAAADLSCNSCHDNHGKLRRLSNGTFATTGAPTVASGSYTTSADPLAGQAVGAYRLLRGPGSTAGSGGKTFTAVFNAVVAGTYNRSEATGQTAEAFGAGISDWCATCHPDMHSATSTKMTHPVNQGLGTAIADIYNNYKGSGIVGASGFDSLIPFQKDNTTDYAALRTAANTGAALQAASTDRVMCLSCHRAHASGFKHMVRWQNEGEFIAVNAEWPGTDLATMSSSAKYAMGRSQAETIAAYNGKPETNFASYQRSLCNKCHGKD